MSSTVRDAPGTDSSQATACRSGASRARSVGVGRLGRRARRLRRAARRHAVRHGTAAIRHARLHACSAASRRVQQEQRHHRSRRSTHLRGAAAEVEDDAHGGAVDALHDLLNLRGHARLRHGPWGRRWGSLAGLGAHTQRSPGPVRCRRRLIATGCSRGAAQGCQQQAGRSHGRHRRACHQAGGWGRQHGRCDSQMVGLNAQARMASAQKSRRRVPPPLPRPAASRFVRRGRPHAPLCPPCLPPMRCARLPACWWRRLTAGAWPVRVLQERQRQRSGRAAVRDVWRVQFGSRRGSRGDSGGCNARKKGGA